VDDLENLIVVDSGNNRLQVLNFDGINFKTGNFSQPYGVAVDLTGKIIVADTLNNRVVEIISPFVDPPHDPNSIFADGFE